VDYQRVCHADAMGLHWVTLPVVVVVDRGPIKIAHATDGSNTPSLEAAISLCREGEAPRRSEEVRVTSEIHYIKAT
jgi:hypothetical protein